MLLLLLFVVPVLALAAAIVIKVVRPGRLTNGVLAAAVALATLYAVAWVAIATDFRDADGFIDCWPHCSALQEAVGIGVTWIPILMGVLAVVDVVYAFVAPRRGAPRSAA